MRHTGKGRSAGADDAVSALGVGLGLVGSLEGFMLFFVHAVDDVSGEQLMLTTSPAMEALMWIAVGVW